MGQKPLLIDAAGHLKGRLGAFVAKLLLQGQVVKILRCEQIMLSGPFYRNKAIFLSYLRKRCNVNPRRGPFHFRAPSKIFYKCVRGMLPIKTNRGREALKRLSCFEGIPQKYNNRRPKIVPEVMRAVRSDPANKFCYLGRVAHRIGWHYRTVIERLERRRLIKKSVDINHKKRVAGFKKQAVKYVAHQMEPYQRLKMANGYNK